MITFWLGVDSSNFFHANCVLCETLKRKHISDCFNSKILWWSILRDYIFKPKLISLKFWYFLQWCEWKILVSQASLWWIPREDFKNWMNLMRISPSTFHIAALPLLFHHFHQRIEQPNALKLPLNFSEIMTILFKTFAPCVVISWDDNSTLSFCGLSSPFLWTAIIGFQGINILFNFLLIGSQFELENIRWQNILGKHRWWRNQEIGDRWTQEAKLTSCLNFPICNGRSRDSSCSSQLNTDMYFVLRFKTVLRQTVWKVFHCVPSY